jgi:hypothetical protein
LIKSVHSLVALSWSSQGLKKLDCQDKSRGHRQAGLAALDK